MKKLIFLLMIPLFFISCHKSCYTSPEPVIFEFVNAAGQNLIQNGSLPTFAIQENTGNGNYIGVQLTKTNDYKVILERVGSFNGTKNYQFMSEMKFFDFSIQSSNATDGCDGYQINTITFKSISASKIDNYYRIVLE